MAVGDRFSTADLIMEVTAPRMPCRILSERMNDLNFAKRYTKAARPGFYCRILHPGRITVGAEVNYKPFNGQRIAMAEMMAHFGTNTSSDLIERYRSVPVYARLRTSLSLGRVKF